MNAVATTFQPRPNDPAELGYPPTLPVEIALRTASLPDICAAYNLSKADWDNLRHDPTFIADLTATVEMLKQEGMSFKMKARLQSEELLKKSWQMIHDRSGNTPPAVQADLLKFTVRAAGLDGSKDQAGASMANSLSIQINL